MSREMTNEEALKAWEKLYAEIDKENWIFVGTINPEIVSLAIKALEERPHGEWINPFTSLSGEFYAKCNICGENIIASLKHNYCPNCGAEMRGKNDYL